MATGPSTIDGGDDELSWDVLSPARERRTALAREAAILLVLAALIYGPTAYQIVVNNYIGETAGGIAALGSLILALVPLSAADCIGPAARVAESQAEFLTGKTITGWRSIALDKIVMVRYRNSPPSGAGYTPDFLMVTDADGARLGVSTRDPDGVLCIASAVRHSAARLVKLSPGAIRALNLASENLPHAQCRDSSFLIGGVLIWLLLLIAYVGSVATWIP